MIANKRNNKTIKGGLTGVIFAFLFSSCVQAESRSIELWVTPVGGYSDPSVLEELAQDFHAEHADIEVSVRVLDAETGKNEIAASFGTDNAPDLVLSSPENIVTEWGGSGSMADLGLLWEGTVPEEIDGEVQEACVNSEGIYYLMPVFRDVYTMALNYEVFRDTALLQYLAEDVHSWKDSGFIDCILVLHDYMLHNNGEDMVIGKIPCKDQRDQRYFMSFITNLSNGSLINDTRTAYKVSSSSIRSSFAILRKLKGKGIEYDAELSSEDALQEFISGKLPITFSWSYYRHQQYADQADFTVFPIMYPNSKNLPVLTGDICGFGVVDNGDAQRIQDAIDFIEFVTGNPEEYKKAVELSGCFPVRTSVNGFYVSGLYKNDEDSRLFKFFMDYFKDYYPTMPLFSELEEEWPELVSQIAKGGKIKALTSAVDEELNKNLEEKYGIVEIVSE